MTGLIRHLEPNTRGQDYVAGDIHGYVGLVERLLTRLGFDPAVDRLLAVGDLIDRGPESAAALMLTENPWFYSVRGNHEQMMIDALNANGDGRPGRHLSLWQKNGGDWSRKTGADRLSVLRERALELPIAMTIAGEDGQTIGLVHAGVPDNRWERLAALEAKPNAAVMETALWTRESAYRLLGRGRYSSDDFFVSGIDRTYHGHTPMAYPTAASNTRWLDTGVFLPDGGLSITRIADDRVWTVRHDGAIEEDAGWLHTTTGPGVD